MVGFNALPVMQIYVELMLKNNMAVGLLTQSTAGCCRSYLPHVGVSRPAHFVKEICVVDKSFQLFVDFWGI